METTKTSYHTDLVPLKPPCLKYLQDDDVTEKCKSLISTLPKEQGWAASYLYQYQGFWHPSKQLQGVLTCQRHFQARDTDLILITSPKCGTTWLKALAFAVINRQTHAIGGDNHPLITYNPHHLVPFLELKLYSDPQLVPDLTGLPSPGLFSTHLPIKSLPVSIIESGCKVVYLARDPKDVFISLWHFINKIVALHKGKMSLEEAFDKFCKGVTGYGPFWDHVLGYWKYSLDNPQSMFFLKFEDLKEEPKIYLKRLAEFWGCPFSSEEENEGVIEQILGLCSFDTLSNLEVNKTGVLPAGIEHKTFFRKDETGDWTNYFTQEMVEKFNQISQEKFHHSGLKF